MNKLVCGVCVILAMLSGCANTSPSAPSAEELNAIKCVGFKPKAKHALGSKTGAELMKVIDAYNQDKVGLALGVLGNIKTNNAFDRASVDSLHGRMLAGVDGRSKDALRLIKRAIGSNALSEKDQADNLKAVADLSLGEKNYQQAIKYYKEWLDYTCKEDEDVYTRMAQAYFELKRMGKVSLYADKAIAMQKTPNKNPYLLKMGSFYDSKQYSKTIATLEKVVELFPEDVSRLVTLSQFKLLVEDYAGALDSMELALRKGAVNTKSEIKTLANVYVKNQKVDKAISLVKLHSDEPNCANEKNSARNTSKELDSEQAVFDMDYLQREAAKEVENGNMASASAYYEQWKMMSCKIDDDLEKKLSEKS